MKKGSMSCSGMWIWMSRSFTALEQAVWLFAVLRAIRHIVSPSPTQLLKGWHHGQESLSGGACACRSRSTFLGLEEKGAW